MRSFIALSVPGVLHMPLGHVQKALPRGRSIPHDDLHVTLAFLDDQPQERLEDLHLELEQIRASQVEIEVTGLGTLGSAPALVMAELAATDSLIALQKKVARACHLVGVSLPKRRFQPHITLVRYGKNSLPLDTGAASIATVLQAKAGLRLSPATARNFGLYQSVLHSDGAIHDILAEYPLT